MKVLSIFTVVLLNAIGVAYFVMSDATLKTLLYAYATILSIFIGISMIMKEEIRKLRYKKDTFKLIVVITIIQYAPLLLNQGKLVLVHNFAVVALIFGLVIYVSELVDMFPTCSKTIRKVAEKHNSFRMFLIRALHG